MRINVGATQFNGAAPAGAYDPTGNGGPLAADLPKAFAAVQDKPIVPQSWQNTAYGTNYTDNVAHIYAGTFQQPFYTFNEGGVAQTMTGFQMDSAGTGYTIAPTVVLTGGLDPAAVASGMAVPAVAHAVLDVAGQRVVGITLDSAGQGYISAPTVALVGGDGVGASATALTDATQVVEVKNKGIQELFDNNYGRMNATFSAELPFTSVLSQTTVPLGYADPPTEAISDGEVQFWKITHNGVDAHVVHFHLFNVQVINRVGWDGHIKPREASEYGWKETVKMMPLEDIYVAVRPKSPLQPFGIPQSIRPLDPTQPLGVTTGFTQVNPLTGAATTIANAVYNYNWEYAWHCHILGHEENDFMRPMVFDFGTQPPVAVSGMSYNASTQSVTWIDPTPTGVASTYGNKANEQGFIVQRTDTGTFDALPANPPQSAAMASLNPAGYSPYVVGANMTSWHDPVPASSNTQYRVVGFNSAGYSPVGNVLAASTNTVTTCAVNGTGTCQVITTTSTPVNASVPGATSSASPNAPTNMHGSVGAFNYTTGAYPISITWNATSVPKNGFLVTRTGGTDLAGNISADVTFNVAPTAASTPTSVSLTPVANRVAITANGIPVSGLANDGYAFSSALSPSSVQFGGQTFVIGNANTSDAVAATTVPLPTGSFSALTILATKTYGGNASEIFVVNYTDGTSSSYVQGMSDWGLSSAYPGESIAYPMAYRVMPSGATQTGPWNLYGYTFAINSAKTVKSLTLPADGNVVLFAANLSSAFGLVDPNGLEISGFKYVVQGDNGTAAAPLLGAGTFVDVLTGYAPPPAINNVTAKVAPSGNSVAISWAAPPMTSPDALIPATSHITAYNVVRTNNGVKTTFAVQQVINPLGVTVTPPATTFTDTAPVSGTSTYTVYGVNGNLTGTTAGATSTATVTLAATAAPGLTGASAVATGPTSVVINWSAAPAGSSPTGYRISRTSGTTTTVLVTPAGLATTFIDTTVVQNTSYTYTVTWLSGASAGVSQTTAPVLTPYAPAIPVSSVTVAFSAATNANTLTWVAGGPSTSYVISRCLATAANANCTNATTVFSSLAQGVTGLTYVDSAITDGTYVYQVQAMNGPVNLSSPVRAVAVTDAVIPAAPATFSNVIASGSVTVNWTASVTPATTAYALTRSVNGGAYAAVTTLAAGTLTYTDTTVALGNTYAYQIVAQVTANGVTTQSATPATTTAAYVVQNGATLGAVKVAVNTSPTYTVTGATAAATSTITVPFTGTAVANAAAVSGYNLYAYINGATTATKLNTALIAATATSTTYTGAVGSTYAFYVTEVNVLGESAAPAAAGLTTVRNGLAAPLVDTATPPKLTSLILSLTDTVTLDWSPLEASVNGVAATSYVVQWSNSASNFAAVGNSGSQTLTLAQATAAGTVAGTSASSTVTGTGAAAAVKTTFTAVTRGTIAPATPSNTIYFRVNTVSGANTSYGAVQVLNQSSTPKLP